MDKQEVFEKVKAQHPDWTDDQIWTQVSIVISADPVIEKQGPDVTVETVLRAVLEKAKEWLMRELPAIFAKVVKFFDDLIDRLPEWAREGLRYVIRMIGKVLIQTDYDYE
mgnify:CR=1 FL=1